MLKNLIYLLGVLLLSACMFPGSTPLPEPQSIIVRNFSGIDLELVTLASDSPDKNSAQRFASVSPVLNGFSQVTERGSAPPPLPRQVVLTWVERGGREYARSIDLAPILSPAKKGPAFALTFELQPAGELIVILTTLP